MPAAASSSAPLRTVLNRLSHELSHGIEVSLGLQDSVAELVSSGSEVSDDQTNDLQALDRLTQILQCLHGFLNTLSEEIDPDSEVDLAEAHAQVFLRDLADRLHPIVDKADAGQNEDGELDLF